jgi:hypothetical protein
MLFVERQGRRGRRTFDGSDGSDGSEDADDFSRENLIDFPASSGIFRHFLASSRKFSAKFYTGNLFSARFSGELRKICKIRKIHNLPNTYPKKEIKSGLNS